MPVYGYLDTTRPMELAGWALDPERPTNPLKIDIRINDQNVALLDATIFRHDLKSGRIGTARHGFSFNPFELLRPGLNVVEARCHATGQILDPGPCTFNVPPNFENARLLAEDRWKQDEPDSSLTWGLLLTGDSFLDEVQRFFEFSAGTRVLEIGPGYGRLLRTIQHRALPFTHYLGIDVCAPRTRRLRRRFSECAGVQFETGDCGTYSYPEDIDLVMCSILSERLFPSMRRTLANLGGSLRAGAMVFFDFLGLDDGLLTAKAWFEEDLYRAFMRVYSRGEMKHFFEEAGFKLLDIVYPLVVGLAPDGSVIERALAAAVKID